MTITPFFNDELTSVFSEHLSRRFVPHLKAPVLFRESRRGMRESMRSEVRSDKMGGGHKSDQNTFYTCLGMLWQYCYCTYNYYVLIKTLMAFCYPFNCYSFHAHSHLIAFVMLEPEPKAPMPSRQALYH